MSVFLTDYIVIQDGPVEISLPSAPGYFPIFHQEFEIPNDISLRRNPPQRPILMFKMRANGNFNFRVRIVDDDDSSPRIDININDLFNQEKTYHEVIRSSDLAIGNNRISFEISPLGPGTGGSLIISDVVLFFQRNVDADTIPSPFS